MSLRTKQINPDRFYVCAYKPGLNERRNGVAWLNGIAKNVPGEYVLEKLIGHVSPLAVFEHGTPLRWDRGRPVAVTPDPPPAPAPTASTKPKAKPKAKAKAKAKVKDGRKA